MKKIFLLMLLCFLPAYLIAQNLPSYKQLCSFLVDIKGWKAEKCNGIKMKSNLGSMVSATRRYYKGEKNFEVSIFSGMQAMGYWTQFSTNLQMETNEVLIKTTNIKGYPVGINISKADKSGGIFVCLNKNSQQCNAILVLNFEKLSKEEALKIAQKYDWDKIASLFK